MPKMGPLLIAPSGTLVDQETYLAPTAQLLNGASNKNPETNIRDLIRVIHYATHDSSVTGLVLQLDHLQGGGISKMQELGAVIEKFKEAGKPVIAFSDNYSQQQYFLASYADKIYMHDLGSVLIQGFGLYRTYYKDALDKLAVNFRVFKVGNFKDFVEPYTRNSMSEASRQHNGLWLNQLWQAYTQQVETQRKLEPGDLNNLINNLPERLSAVQGDMAKLALKERLVDFIGSRVEYEQSIAELFGASDDAPFLNIPYGLYKKNVLKNPLSPDGDIGLIVASGTILDGHQPAGTIGGDSLSELIRSARKDKNIKALVLRIDSGGGSAFASEIIRHELQATRDQGIPVVVSMGSVAASGGYWMAMAADEVWATPNTITGSIGVFSLLPIIDKSMEKLGLHSDGFGTTKLAGALRIDRPLSQEAAQAYQSGVESIYQRFITLVANSRNSSAEAVHEVAQGRVWTGSKAKELGLVDELGFLSDAVASAASKAGISNFKVKHIQKPLTPQEQLMRQILQQAETAGLRELLTQWSGLPPQALQALNWIQSQTQHLSTLQTPKAAYALCLACIAP